VNALKPHLQATLRTLLAQNVKQREIARLTGIDRKTIRNYQKRLAEEPANSPGVATGSVAQAPPPRPPASVPSPGVTVSLCEPHREFIEAQLRLRRNAGRPRLFVMTLRYSRRSFRRVVWNSSQQVWAQLHEQAWRYFVCVR